MKKNTLLNEEIFRCRKRRRHCLLLVVFLLGALTVKAQQTSNPEQRLSDGSLKITGGPLSYRTATSPELSIKKLNIVDLSIFKRGVEGYGIKGEIGSGGSITLKAYLYDPNEPDLHKYLIYGTRLSAPAKYAEYTQGTPWDVPAGNQTIKSHDMKALYDFANIVNANNNSRFSNLISREDELFWAQINTNDMSGLSGPSAADETTEAYFQPMLSSLRTLPGYEAVTYSRLGGESVELIPNSGRMSGVSIRCLYAYIRAMSIGGCRATVMKYRREAAAVGGGAATVTTIVLLSKLLGKDKDKPDGEPALSPEDQATIDAAKKKFLKPVIIEVTVKNATLNSIKLPGITEVSASDFARSDNQFYLGADLSSVNEVEDYYKTKTSGSTALPYKQDGVAKDVYQIFHDKGSNLVRLRLWHNPTWTKYSNLADVIKGLRRAKSKGFQTLLDFHYSDSWADPGKQVVPAAWKSVVNNLPALSDSVYNYTKTTLMTLYNQGLLPDLVQLGNEINNNILVATAAETDPNGQVNFSRNATLLNRALQAVGDVEEATGSTIKKALHIGGGPHLADWWLSHHQDAGLQLDKLSLFGFSYYFYNRDPEAPGKAVLDINGVSLLAKSIRDKYKLNVLLMETGAPWTLANNDGSGNMYGQNNLLKTYGKPSPQAVKNFMTDLTYAMKTQGQAAGVIYWEPAWISSATRASVNATDPLGSPYENAALFDFSNNAHAGMDFYSANYDQSRLQNVNVTFNLSVPANLAGSSINIVLYKENNKMEIFPMQRGSGANTFTYTASLVPRTLGGYTFIKGTNPDFTGTFPWNIEPLYWGIYSRTYPVEDLAKTIKYLPIREYALAETNNQVINVTWGQSTAATNNFVASFKKNYDKTTATNFSMKSGADNISNGTAIQAKVGDVLTTEWRADFFPYAENVTDSLNKQLKVDGLPAIWIANQGGESRYYCSPSVQPGELNPWLGYDSQVHGTALRNYDSTGVWKFQVKAKSWQQDLVKQSDTIYGYRELGQVKMYLNWSLAREMSSSVSGYTPSFTWDKTQSSGSNPISLPDGTTSPKQRNNQREGLNMELLHAWSPDWKNISSDVNFAAYASGSGNKPKYILGTDPDELLYMDSQTSDAENNPPKDGIIQTAYEMWKIVPAGEGDPVNDMVTAYRKNRESFLKLPVKSKMPYAGYEVQDNGVSATQPDGLGTVQGNNKAPGADLTISLNLNGTEQARQHFKLNVTNRLSGGSNRGFYGNIIGTQWPAIWEKKVPYTLTGLSGWSDEELKRVSFELQYEDHRGVIMQQTRYLKDSPALLEQVRTSGNWTVNDFYMQGWGYYTLTAYYQYDNTVDRVPLTGKELLDVGLRFVSNDGEPLKEGRGDGAYTYLDEFRSTTTDPFGLNKNDVKISDTEKHLTKYGRYAGKFVRTYTFKVGETSNFVAFDSDPHTFTSAGTEFYLSPRTRAKRLSDDSLSSGNRQYLKYYIRKIDENGNYGAEQLQTGTGKNFTKTWSETGIFQLRVSYRDVSDVYHLIKVKNYKKDVDYTDKGEPKREPKRGEIIVQPLNLQAKEMLRLPAPEKNKQWYEAQVVNVLSKYKYVSGPRASVQTKPDVPVKDRFGEFGDFADQYLWKMGEPAGSKNYTFTNQLALPDSAVNWVLKVYNPKIHNSWFPRYWARHYNQKGYPPDFGDKAKALVKKAGSAGLDDKLSRMVSSAYSTRPETWQMRLPWIAATNYSGYRIRTNIKPVYILDSLFSNYSGAFTGKAAIPGDQAIFLDIQSDEQKDKEEWYNDLYTGKRIVFQADPKVPYALMVKNYFTENDPKLPAGGATRLRDSLIAITTVLNEVQYAEQETPGVVVPKSGSAGKSNQLALAQDEYGARQNYLEVYPNPADDLLRAAFDVEETGEIRIELYDMAGRQVLKQQLYQEKGRYTSTLDVSRLSPGAYILKLIAKGSVRTKKVIII